jgi:hypothetical protein
MGALLDEVGGALDLDALLPFARWLPAGVHHKVFDTRFYLARAPEGAEPVVDGNENVRVFWASARAVLDAAIAAKRRSSSRRAATSNGSHCSPASPMRPPMPARIRCAPSRPGSRRATTASTSASPTISAIRSRRSRSPGRSAHEDGAPGDPRDRRLRGAAGLIFFAIYALVRNRPQDLPWTRLDLGQPIGAFTGRKLAGLTDNFAECRALLQSAGVRYTILPTVRSGEQCGYADALRFAPGGSQRIEFSPERLGVSCPVAAALAMWEWNVLQPAAQKHFGARVERIEHLGSYSCRRMYGRSAGDWSEHATADAIDVAGFRLSDGTHIRVLGDWEKGGSEGGVPARGAHRRVQAVLDGAVARLQRGAPRSLAPRPGEPRGDGVAGLPVRAGPHEVQLGSAARRPFPPIAGRRPAGGSTSPRRSPRLR